MSLPLAFHLAQHKCIDLEDLVVTDRYWMVNRSRLSNYGVLGYVFQGVEFKGRIWERTEYGGTTIYPIFLYGLLAKKELMLIQRYTHAGWRYTD